MGRARNGGGKRPASVIQLHSTAPASSHPTTAAQVEEKPSTHLRTLYPTTNATNNGTLDVDSTHTLYYEQYNNPPNTSLNALFLHGGPGAGCFPNHARFFSPDHYRVTLLDQRGCGRSTPKGETANNTLTHLVQDIESLRIHLGYEKWDLILGGSWGTTLALAYSQTYPERVGSMVLRGVCLFRQAEIDWLFARNGGADKLNADGWKDFEKAVGIDADELNLPVLDDSGYQVNRDALNRYYDCLLGVDPALRVSATSAWMKWEMSIFSLNKKGNQNVTNITDNSDRKMLAWDEICGWSYHDAFGPIDAGETDALAVEEAERLRRFSLDVALEDSVEFDDSASPTSPRPIDENVGEYVDAKLQKLPPNVTVEQAKSFVPAQAMLTCYYSANIAFVMGQYHNLLSPEGIERLRNAGISCIAVQGGKDSICPPDSALDLLQVWPEVELRIPLEAGHSMYDAEICSELVRATDRFAGIPRTKPKRTSEEGNA